MNYIGNIIKEFRCMVGMSRKELSENICSEKYVYLIEKGERTPSAGMILLLGEKMGVDLFIYYQYLDCIDPIAVRKKMEEFDMYRRKGDFNAVNKEAEIAKDLPDFHCKPWSYEIDVNRLSYKVFVQGKYHEAIIGIITVMDNIEPKYSKGIYVANLYILLSTCHQLTGDLVNAKKAILSAYEIIRNKHKITRYKQVIITVIISAMTMHYLAGEMDEVIRIGNDLLQYLHEADSFDRIHYPYFYLAFAYYKTGLYDESIACFSNAIHSVMISDKYMDVYYITSQDFFDVLIHDERIDQQMVCEFKKKYNL